jgi:RNA polymerase sigma factor (sigma-70 family)
VARSYRLPDNELEDVFQEVFAALVKGLPRLRDARSLVRWLSSTTERIASTAALRHRRERALCAQESDWIEELDSQQSPVGADLEELEEQAMVRLAVSALPQGCRELLTALFYDSPRPSYAELSHRFSLPIGSIGPCRARCLEHLRRIVLDLSSEKTPISQDLKDTSTFLGRKVRRWSKSLRTEVLRFRRDGGFPSPRVLPGRAVEETAV